MDCNFIQSTVIYNDVALLRACVENEAGPSGSWTEEQVRKGERERETLTHVWTKKHTGKRAVYAEDTSGARDRAKEHEYMYINEYMQTNQTVTTDQAGETDADACSPMHTGDTMEVLPEAHGRSSEQHEPPETCRKESYGERQRGSVRLRSDNTSSSQFTIPFSHRLPLFYSSRRGRLHRINSH